MQPQMSPRDLEMKPRNLSVLNYANGFTFWHYRAEEEPISLRHILHPVFFTAASHMFRRGDMIMVSARDGGAHLFVSHVHRAARPSLLVSAGHTDPDIVTVAVMSRAHAPMPEGEGAEHADVMAPVLEPA